MKKYLIKTIFALPVFLVFYLFVVFIWADSVAEGLLIKTPSRDQSIQIQPRHVSALIKIEDPTFHDHPGLDISTGQGVTTITGVVARDLFLGSHDTNGFAGAMQSFYRGVFKCCKKVDLGRDVMALVLDSRTTKQQQLNLYISRAYFGSMDGKAVIGFEAAARAYHGKELSQLTDKEFYGIMAMPIAPNYYHPIRNPELHAERVKRIQALVAGTCEPDGWLDLTYETCSTGG